MIKVDLIETLESTFRIAIVGWVEDHKSNLSETDVKNSTCHERANGRKVDRSCFNVKEKLIHQIKIPPLR